MSDWKQRSVQRRDERHTAVACIRPPSSSSKNTKRWCRGVVGREHQSKWVSYNEANRTTFAPANWKILQCEVCRKQLDYHWPSTRNDF